MQKDNFKPLLASSDFVLEELDFSNLVMQPKLDGIRAIVKDGVVLSRSLKPIPNPLIQEKFSKYEGLDGELIEGNACDKDVYNKTFRVCMTKQKVPVDNLSFMAFDSVLNPDLEYADRFKQVIASQSSCVKPVFSWHCNNLEDALEYERLMLNKGYEGLMLRAFRGPNSKYKFGRATGKSCTLLKLKRFTDAEAVVVRVEEEMLNANEVRINELGYSSRSSVQGNLIAKDRLGALICRTPEGIEFGIGTGFTAEQRKKLWQKKDDLVGMLVKYKHFEIGAVQAPRFPVFIGFRDPIDM